MTFHAIPAPGDGERAAIARALARVLEGRAPPAYASAWRLVGLRENVELKEPPRTARPRSTRGATRA